MSPWGFVYVPETTQGEAIKTKEDAVLEIFDRWITGRKINLLKDQIAHAQDEHTKHVLEEALAAEQTAVEQIDNMQVGEK
jgi:hypothetical protein